MAIRAPDGANKDDFTLHLIRSCFYQPPAKSTVWFFFLHRFNLEKISFSPKSWMFMESDHGGKTSLTNSSSFAPRTLSSFLWTFINNTITSTLSLVDPLCYNHSNHPIQSPKYLICLQYKLSLLTKKLLWELNILGNLDARSYQLTLCNTYYISKHRCVETACFFLLFWYNFFSHWKCRNTKKLRL